MEAVDRTFLIVTPVGDTSKLSNFTRAHRIASETIVLPGAQWEVSVLGGIAGQPEQLHLTPTIIYEGGSQHVEFNIENVQGPVGPNAQIVNSTLIQLNSTEAVAFKDELIRLAERMGSLEQKTLTERSTEISLIESARAELEEGNQSRAVELLRQGGEFVLETARQLGLELLVRLILPAGSS
jgi:hypothetical protein